MKRAGPLLSVALVALLLASCRSGTGDDTYVLTVTGSARVISPAVESLGPGRHRLARGQTVRITKGSAKLGLPGKSTLELRAGGPASTSTTGASRRPDSLLTIQAVPELVDGDALAVTDASLRLAAGGASIMVREGAARVRRSSGVTFAVYRGEATVTALGARLAAPVRALRQVSVSDAGTLPRQAGPLVYDRSHPDRWDVRYLGSAIALGDQLERRSRALTLQMASDGPPDVALLRSLVPKLRSQAGFGPDLVDGGRSVGETLVGASIALGAKGNFARRWTSAFEFRQQGADWGLVALDQRAPRSAVIGVLDGILDSVTATLVVAGPGLGSGAGGASPAIDSLSSKPPSAATPGGPSGPGSPSPRPPTETTLPPVPVPSLLTPILPLLPAPTSSSPSTPSSSPLPSTPLTPTVTGLLEGLDSTVGGLLGGG